MADRAKVISAAEDYPVTDRELHIRQEHAKRTGRPEPVGTPAYVEEYLTILMKKYTAQDDEFDLLDAKRYGRLLGDMTEAQARHLTQVMDETFRYRPDVAQVVELKEKLFPSLHGHLNRSVLPQAQAAAYMPYQSVAVAQGQIEGTGEVSEPGLDRLREITRQLESRMSPEERRQTGILREERIRAEKGKKGKGQGHEFVFNEDAARRKLDALKAQTALLTKGIETNEK